MRKLCLFLLFLIAGTSLLFAQAIEKNVEERLTDFFSNYTTVSAKINRPALKSVEIDFDRKRLTIQASESFAYQPFLPETVESIYNQVENLLPGPVRFFDVFGKKGHPVKISFLMFTEKRKRIRHVFL